MTERLVLFAGISPEWFRRPEGMEIKGLETYFGSCALKWQVQDNTAVLRLSGTAEPPNGFVLRLPPSLKATVILDGESLPVAPNGDCLLPKQVKRVYVQFDSLPGDHCKPGANLLVH